MSDRPPPYFPQSRLSPPDPNRYRKFKALVVLAVLIILGVIAGMIYGIYYLLKTAGN